MKIETCGEYWVLNPCANPNAAAEDCDDVAGDRALEMGFCYCCCAG